MFSVWKDLLGGTLPPPIELPYNGDLAVDSVTKRYKGSFVKFMDYDDVDHGTFCTFAGLTTEMENFMGILMEEQGITDNYLPDDASYSCRTRKITPCFPSTVILGEYAQIDAAGTATTDTAGTADAASATFTITITTADTFMGGWIYFTNGSNANKLHYALDNSTTTITFATVTTGAVVAADDFLAINPPMARLFDLNATLTGITSEVDNNARSIKVMGLMTYITDVGIPFQPLNRDKHDGLILKNPRFYHAFTIPSAAAGGNMWIMGPALA